MNKYPPAKLGGFHKRVKPYVTSTRVPSRKYGLSTARACYLLPVNGLRNFPLLSVLLPYPHLTGGGYTPLFSLRSSQLYPHNIPSTKILSSGIYIPVLDTSHISLGFPFKYPIKLDTATFGGISSSICTWSGHTSASTIRTSFHSHSVRSISHISHFSP